MANIEASFTAFILTYDELASLVGNRVVWDTIPEGMSRPLIRLRTIGDALTHNHQTKAVSRAVVEAHVLADTKSACNQIADLLKTLFNGYNGAIGSFRARILVNDAPSDWAQDERLFLKTVEMDIGYA